MAIRIRFRNGKYTARCAAKSKPKAGDIYLNDGMHEAFSEKFWNDFIKMGFIKEPNENCTSQH